MRRAGTAWGHTEVAQFVPGKGATVSTPVKVVGVRFEGPVVTGLLTLTTASDGHRKQDTWTFRVR
jgi:hypothetical protein